MQPLVSVYIPTRNRSRLVARAIDSVLAQSVREVEVLVVDDASETEHRQTLIAKYKDEDRVDVICNEVSKGAGNARNLAIEQARGEFITGLDDDDWFESNRIQVFLGAWEDRTRGADISALFTPVKYVMPSGEKTSRVPSSMDSDRLLMGNYIGNQVFTLTESFRAIGGFDAALPAMQDFDTWLRLTARFGPAMGLPEPTYVVDMTHGGERISDKPAATLRQAYALICSKHNLTDRQARQMKALLFSYRQIPMTLVDLLEQWSLGNYRQSTATWVAKRLGIQS